MYFFGWHAEGHPPGSRAKKQGNAVKTGAAVCPPEGAARTLRQRRSRRCFRYAKAAAGQRQNAAYPSLQSERTKPAGRTSCAAAFAKRKSESRTEKPALRRRVFFKKREAGLFTHTDICIIACVFEECKAFRGMLPQNVVCRCARTDSEAPPRLRENRWAWIAVRRSLQPVPFLGRNAAEKPDRIGFWRGGWAGAAGGFFRFRENPSGQYVSAGIGYTSGCGAAALCRRRAMKGRMDISDRRHGITRRYACKLSVPV